jgi:hypothetical protein
MSSSSIVFFESPGAQTVFGPRKKIGLLINRRNRKEKQFLTYYYGCQGCQEKIKIQYFY